MNQLQFLRALIVFNGLIPLVMLSWDGYRGQLGANSVNNALHITGILSLVFLLLSLLMSPLKWGTGWGGWIAFRRVLGLYGFFYSVIHLLIYVGFDRALNLSSTVNEIWMRRFLQVGAIAIVLMIPLAVTSTNRMIQRLGPVRWKLLHRAAYAVAALGVLHYYMLVKADVRQPLAFAGVLGVLLGGRVARHYFELQQAVKKKTVPGAAFANRTKLDSEDLDRKYEFTAGPQKSSTRWNGELRVAAIFQETPDVKTFRLMASNDGPFPFDYQPGQFLSLHLTIDGEQVNRSYTLASSPTRRDCCELTIKREPMGIASRFLHDQSQVGDLIKTSGPSGKFIFTGNETSSVVLIAGGVGITPLMSITRYLTDRAWSGDIYFLIVAKTEQDLIFYDEIKLLQKRFPKLHVCITLTRCNESSMWTGERGRANRSLLQKFVPNLASALVYLCGPNQMMDETRELVRELGVLDSFVRTEAFAGKKSAFTASNETEVELMESSEATTSPVGTLPSATKAKTTSTVRFSRSIVQTEISDQTTILEAAEALSVPLPFECRSGFCGQCKTRLIEGQVQMDCEDALSQTEKSSGWILACQAHPKSNVIVDA